MKRNKLIALAAATIMIICFSAGIIAQEDHEKIQKERITKMIEAVNSADEAKISAFFKENFQPDEEKFKDRVSKMMGTKEQLGEMKIVNISYESKEVAIVDIECMYMVTMTVDFLPENNYLIKTVKLEAKAN